MQGLSERQYAARAGLSRGAIQKAKATDRLELFPDGSIDAPASDAKRAATTDPSKQRNAIPRRKLKPVPDRQWTPSSVRSIWRFARRGSDGSSRASIIGRRPHRTVSCSIGTPITSAWISITKNIKNMKLTDQFHRQIPTPCAVAPHKL
jgi:hypothetical protein